MRQLKPFPVWLALVGACAPTAEPGPTDGGVARDASNSVDAGASAEDAGSLDASSLPDSGSICGDGQLDPEEHCDDGNQVEDDDCANDCTPTAAFRSYDDEILGLLTAYDVPGATVAVTKDERLVLLRAYGLADVASQRVMARGDRMRIASLSKPITSAAVLLLVERGQLGLDDRAFAFFDELETPPGQTRDPRLQDITIGHLLVHAGGWSREESGDPMFKSRVICQALNLRGPATAEDTLRYMLGQALDFTPGTDFHYSNFGYSVLGRIIERVTGQSYERFVQDEVLAPLEITGMEVGRTFPEDRPADEVSYHLHDDAIDVVSVFPDVEGRVPRTEGGWHQEALDSHGGWIANVTDLSRFMTGVDGRPHRQDLLRPETVELMTQRPDLAHWQNRNLYYTMGWMVRPERDGANWWHNGSLPGTSTLFVRTWNGLTWVVLTNSRPIDANGFLGDLDQALWRAAGSVSDWPDYDLFAR